jgi:copper chaperone NosL
MRPLGAIIPLAFLLSTFSCSPEVQVIHVQYLKTECEYCRMLFQDRAFGAEVRLDKDSVLVFDATECLAAYLIDNKLGRHRLTKIWSVDYSRPTQLIDAREAYYIRSDRILSPMGVNIAAFGSKAEADSAYAKIGGDRMNWNGVGTLVSRMWFHNRAIPDSLF